jgi:hypothetical protein
MGDVSTTKRDSVAKILTQLKRGNKITDKELEKAIMYHQSLLVELQTYKDIAVFNDATPVSPFMFVKNNTLMAQDINSTNYEYTLFQPESYLFSLYIILIPIKFACQESQNTCFDK